MTKSVSSRGRPKQGMAAAEEKKKAIVDAARKLFQLEGVEAVSMRKIASAVSVSPMTLYQYFENKSSLLHYIWEEFFAALFLQLETDVAKHDKPQAQLRAACKAYLDYWFGHPDHFRMVFLNEDRAEQENQFFLQHANIEERMNAQFVPLMRSCFPDQSDGEILLDLQLLMCVMNGIALNLITISEYDWIKHQPLLDQHLNRLFADGKP